MTGTETDAHPTGFAERMWQDGWALFEAVVPPDLVARLRDDLM